MFWENHDPTQGMRQGNDAGTQYRSGDLHVSDPQQQASAERRATRTQGRLGAAGYGGSRPRSCRPAAFYYAEDYHQQYLAKNPDGYCGIGGTGVACPIGLGDAAAADTQAG